jgi:hypothetical protein
MFASTMRAWRCAHAASHDSLLSGGVMMRATNRVLTLGAAVMLACSGAAAAQTLRAAPVPETLDLRAPDITRLYTPQQIQAALAGTYERNIEEVEVYGPHERPVPITPQVWSGIAAPLWALLNPVQAWRIFAPIPQDRARWLGENSPDARSAYLEPAAVSPHLYP